VHKNGKNELYNRSAKIRRRRERRVGQFAFNDGALFCLNSTERRPFRMAPHNIIIIIIDMANTEYNNIE